MTTYREMDTKERAAIIRKHLRAVPGLAKLGVRMGRGTACTWLHVSGTGEFGTFTIRERVALEKIGFDHATVSSNGFGIAPEETAYWAERLDNNNTGFELWDNHYEGDGMSRTGWGFKDVFGVYHRIKAHGGSPDLVMAAAKAGKVVRVGKIIVKWVDYNNHPERSMGFTDDAVEMTGEEMEEATVASRKIPAVKIEIERSEGYGNDSAMPTATLTGEALWHLSDCILWAWAQQAPARQGAYDKISYRVTFKDGYVQAGRVELTRLEAGKRGILLHAVWRNVAYNAGQFRPNHMTELVYRRSLKEIYEVLGEGRKQEFVNALATYDISEGDIKPGKFLSS